jgi:hypothetical protein
MGKTPREGWGNARLTPVGRRVKKTMPSGETPGGMAEEKERSCVVRLKLKTFSVNLLSQVDPVYPTTPIIRAIGSGGFYDGGNFYPQASGFSLTTRAA